MYSRWPRPRSAERPLLPVTRAPGRNTPSASTATSRNPKRIELRSAEFSLRHRATCDCELPVSPEPFSVFAFDDSTNLFRDIAVSWISLSSIDYGSLFEGEETRCLRRG